MQGESKSAPHFERHGGRLADAVRAYPLAPGGWIDLSTGINPRCWRPVSGLEGDPAPLPDVEDLAALEASAARFFAVNPAYVAAVPGSEIALRLLRAVGLPSPIAAIPPCYGTHGEVADEMLDLATGAGRHGGTILIANPNNPDGRTINPARLLELAARRKSAGGWLVVDEAFADVAPFASILPLWDVNAPVVVLRSFGKFFGLAGVRLGFMVAPPPVLSRLREMLGDWPVSAQAIAWGRAAYGDTEWIAATRVMLAERAARLDALFARHSLTAIGHNPLFRLVEHRDARIIFERLAHAGILTRPFAARADWLRFGLPGNDQAFDRLDQALSHG